MRYHTMRNSYLPEWRGMIFETLELLGCNRVRRKGNWLHLVLPETLSWPFELWIGWKYWRSRQYAIMHPMLNNYTCHNGGVGFLDTLELLGCNRVEVEADRLHLDLPGTLCWPPELWMDSKYWKPNHYAIMQCAKATCHRISWDSQVVRVQQSQFRRQ